MGGRGVGVSGGVENGEPNVSYGCTAERYTSFPSDPSPTSAHYHHHHHPYPLSHDHSGLSPSPVFGASPGLASPGPGADGASPSPDSGAVMSVQELAALKHAEAMHLACKVALIPTPLITSHRHPH